MRRLGAASLAACLAASSPAAALPGDFILPPGAVARETTFENLPGWDIDDHPAAFRAFRRTCRAVPAADPRLSAGLAAACAAARSGPDLGREDARRFFETRFAPVEVTAGRNLLTAYYEPVFDGSSERSEAFPVPLLGLPADLVSVPPGEAVPGLPPGAGVARRISTGLAPYPDRAAIEAGVLGEAAKPLLYLRDAADAFVVHVQGSARIRLPDGRLVRVAYAGRNGHPYSSVGRLLVERLGIPPAAMGADRLTAWLRAHPDEAPALLAQNRSFIFFRLADELDPADGPVGAAGVPLEAGRSLAIDRTAWPYGLPVWLDGTLPDPDGGSRPLRRLTVAADTGSAITGPTRADLFVGTGEAAGREAAPIRQDVRFVVLWPKAPGPGGP